MWLLIQDGHLTNNSYEKKIKHRKEKGLKRTSFNEAKQQLIYKEKGNPWQKKKQREIGDIIVEDHDKIYLSDAWRNYLKKYDIIPHIN